MPHLAGRDGSAIVNIASLSALHPAVDQVAYVTAKAGVVAFTRAAARELGWAGIRVNAISPGLIDRPSLERDWPEGRRRWLDKAPLGRLGQPSDVAQACLFLASAASRWITGHDLVIVSRSNA